MFRKIILPLLAAVMLAGCATPNNTVNITPKITLPQQDPTLMGVTVSITGADLRQNNALAKVVRDNNIVELKSSRDIRFLMQEVLEKQMVARGYMIGADAPVDLQIVVNNLYADVQEGNLRFNITTRADISIIAQAKNGNKMTKNYRASYNQQGPFLATNEKITNSIDNVLSDVIADMAQDTTISSFVKQNSR